jgi:hypothetical protein
MGRMGASRGAFEHTALTVHLTAFFQEESTIPVPCTADELQEVEAWKLHADEEAQERAKCEQFGGKADGAGGASSGTGRTERSGQQGSASPMSRGASGLSTGKGREEEQPGSTWYQPPVPQKRLAADEFDVGFDELDFDREEYGGYGQVTKGARSMGFGAGGAARKAGSGKAAAKGQDVAAPFGDEYGEEDGFGFEDDEMGSGGSFVKSDFKDPFGLDDLGFDDDDLFGGELGAAAWDDDDDMLM